MNIRKTHYETDILFHIYYINHLLHTSFITFYLQFLLLLLITTRLNFYLCTLRYLDNCLLRQMLFTIII